MERWGLGDMVSDKIRILRQVVEGEGGLSESLRFLIVGSIGFLINLAILVLLHDILKLSVVISQITAAELSILSNFFFHDTWTYRKSSESPLIHRLLKFHGTAWAAGFINSLSVIFLVKNYHFSSLAALVCGSLLALCWSFFMNKFVVWRKLEAAD